MKGLPAIQRAIALARSTAIAVSVRVPDPVKIALKFVFSAAYLLAAIVVVTRLGHSPVPHLFSVVFGLGGLGLVVAHQRPLWVRGLTFLASCSAVVGGFVALAVWADGWAALIVLVVAAGLGGVASHCTAKKYGRPALVWRGMTAIAVLVTLAALTHVGM